MPISRQNSFFTAINRTPNIRIFKNRLFVHHSRKITVTQLGVYLAHQIRKKDIPLKKKLGLLLSATAITLGLAACGTNDNTQEVKNEVGKTVETADLDIQVESVKSGYAESDDKNKQMLIVDMNIKNISKEESGAGAADFEVKADNGKSYDVYGLEEKNFGTAIKPGKTIEGKGYYEIPADAKTVTFYYEPAGKKQAQWELKVPEK